jgi:hypothetical protein
MRASAPLPRAGGSGLRELLDTVHGAHAMRASAPIEVGFLVPIPGGCACAAGFRLAALA